jgi:hypothetical protein
MEARARSRTRAVAQQRRTRLIVCVSAFVAGSSLSCRTDETHRDESASAMTDTVDRAELQEQLGFALPETARIVWRESQQGMDTMLRVKLEMTRSTFDKLAASMPIVEQDLRPGAGRLGRDKGEWNPHSTPGIRSTQLSLPDANFMNVGVAEANGLITVFIMRHGT